MRLWKWERENLPSVNDSARTAVAGTVSFLVARFCQLPEAYWAAIATLVVMQSTLGATLVISVERIAATALGALAGALLATYFGENLIAFAAQSLSSDSRALSSAWKETRIVMQGLH